MEAAFSFGPFSRIFKPLIALFTRRVPDAPVARVVAQSAAARPFPASELKFVAPATAPKVAASKAVAVAVRVVEAPAPVATPAAPIVAPPVATPLEQGPEKPMRTLAEVRADLARLREKSRERQAQARAVVRPDVTFPATDFMEFVPSVAEAHRDQQDAGESFAPTAYLDFTVLKAR